MPIPASRTRSTLLRGIRRAPVQAAASRSICALLLTASALAADEEALSALARGLKSSKAAERVTALQTHGPTADPKALALVVRALRDRERDVRFAAVETLRFSNHERALEGLQRMATSDRDLGEDPELHAALYRAVGQHADPSSLPILAKELLVHRDRRVSRAGILAIANIRSNESVETLISLMRSAGRNRVQSHMVALRLALVVLTGADEGLSQDRWNAWWNDHKRRLQVDSMLPALKEEDRRIWDAHWGIRRRSERAPRRHERGTGDPE